MIIDGTHINHEGYEFHGVVRMADTKLTWAATGIHEDEGMFVEVEDFLTQEKEAYRCVAEDFFIALALAVQYTGEFPGAPAYAENAPIYLPLQWAAAERAQPKNTKLRWIP
jgi:hypothetical protein